MSIFCPLQTILKILSVFGVYTNTESDFAWIVSFLLHSQQIPTIGQQKYKQNDKRQPELLNLESL